MTNGVIVKSYDTKIDSKKRITLRNAIFEYFHVEEYDDGRIVLEPRELTKPFQVSANTLAMMDSAVESFKNSNFSEPVDLNAFIGLEPHPNDKKDAYKKITLSSTDINCNS